jgi:hypothetical protein
MAERFCLDVKSLFCLVAGGHVDCMRGRPGRVVRAVRLGGQVVQDVRCVRGQQLPGWPRRRIFQQPSLLGICGLLQQPAASFSKASPSSDPVSGRLVPRTSGYPRTQPASALGKRVGCRAGGVQMDTGSMNLIRRAGVCIAAAVVVPFVALAASGCGGAATTIGGTTSGLENKSPAEVLQAAAAASGLRPRPATIPGGRANAQLKTWHILRKLRRCPGAGQLARPSTSFRPARSQDEKGSLSHAAKSKLKFLTARNAPDQPRITTTGSFTTRDPAGT